MAAAALAITSSSTGIPVGYEKEWEKGKFFQSVLRKEEKNMPTNPQQISPHILLTRTAAMLKL